MGFVRHLLLATGLVVCLSGCMGHVHTVGAGPQGGEVRREGLWYGAYGFAPIRRLDSRTVVGKSTDYRITTEFRARDVFTNLFTGPFGFFRVSIRIEE